MNIRSFSLFLGAVLLTAAFASAQTKVVKEVNAKQSSAWTGPELYNEFCAVCHGTDGRGNGPAASALKVQPTDLTMMARHNNGKYPDLHIQQVLKGQAEIPAHGSLSMPTWGNIFKSISASGTFADMRINALVEYLKQIQR